MADVKISQLPVLLNANTNPGDSIPIVDSFAGETKQIPLSQLDLRYQGIINGGSTGQVLAKKTSTDKDVEWKTLTKADVGLANVDNTADINKPVSTATQTALNLKADLSYVNAQIAQKGAPAGGTAGQVLKKNTGANYDYSWQDEAGGFEYASVTTGLVEGGFLSINGGDPSKFNLSAGRAIITNYATNPLVPVTVTVNFGPFTAQTITNLASQDDTYIFIDSGGNIFQQGTVPTPEDRRARAYIGRINHPSRVNITTAATLGDFAIDVNSQLYDLMDALGAFSFEGNRISNAGANLNFNKSQGKIFRRSSNYVNDDQNPHYRTIAQGNPQSFYRATQSSVALTPVTTIDPNNYDVGGVITAIPGSVNRATIQRVYAFSNGTVAVQYGQAFYESMAEAHAAVDSEVFAVNPIARDGGVLIGVIVVKKAATALNDPLQAIFINAGKFGIGGGGGGGGSSTTTLQEAYNNSSIPQIVLDAVGGGIQIRDSVTPLSADLWSIRNNAGGSTFFAVGAGYLKMPIVTTTQRDALTPTVGMLVYNSTTGQPEYYDGSAWGEMTREFQGTSTSLSDGNSIPINLVRRTQSWVVSGNLAPATLSTAPFGTTAPLAGAEINLVCNTNDYPVTFVASDTAKGIVPYGFTLNKGQMACVKYYPALDRYVVKSVSN